MQNYKILVSKQGKNFTFVLRAEDEHKARERIHKEGYSILNIEEIKNISEFGHKFLFEAEKNGIKKNGKIIGEDIFKAYIKLRTNLGYDVKYIFEDKEEKISIEEKENIIKELEEEYNLFNNSNKKLIEKDKKEEEKKEIKNIKDSNYDKENFYLKKSLEDSYKTIDFILEKLKNIIDGKEIENISLEEKEKLKNIYYSIVKIKKTTNILKLKEIGEKALLKIGTLELRFLENKKSEKTKNLLSETNGLLKKIGSNKSVNKNNYNINSVILFIKNIINKYFIRKQSLNIEDNNKIDKNSYYFIKNQLLLNKYIEKQKSNRKKLLKNLFNKEKRQEFFLKNKVIKQNIILLKAKVKGIGFSYTLLKKGYNNLFLGLFYLFKKIRISLFYIIVFYTLFFIILINFNYYLNIQYFNYNGVEYIILIIFMYYMLFLTRNSLMFIVNIIIYYFLILFFIINF